MSIRLRKNLTHIPEINSVEYILCMQLFMHFHHGYPWYGLLVCLLIKMKNIISVQTLHLHINQIAKIAICGNNLTVFCTRHQL